MIRFLRMTNADRVAYGDLEPGRFCLETDSGYVYVGTDGGDVKQTAASTPKWNPDAFPAVPSAQDDHFKAGALDGKWTTYNHGVSNLTVTVPDTFARLALASEGGNAHRGIYQPLPAGDFTIITKAALNAVAPTGAGPETSAGLVLLQDGADSAGDLVHMSVIYQYVSLYCKKIYIRRFHNYTTLTANYIITHGGQNTTCYLRIRRNGTTLYYDYSSDGISWQMILTHAQPFVPAHVGITTTNYNVGGGPAYGYFDFFRYIAADQDGPIGEFV